MVIETTLEKIRKQQFKFMADDFDLKSGSSDVSNGTATLYTVPTAKVFYLVSATLQFYDTATALAGTATFVVNGGDIILLHGNDITGGHGEVGLSFPIPLKIAAAETIQIVSDKAQFSVRGAFSGYETDA